jgi:glycosyltransferase involved in cell wall biosynthesis
VGLNIFVINDFAHINGGAAQVALSSAVGLAESGHQVTLLAAVPPISADLVHPNLNVVITQQYEVARDPKRWRAMTQGIWNLKAQKMIRSTLQDADPRNTIIHLHGWSKALSSSVVRECLSRRFKVVCTLHDYFVACPNGGFYNFQTDQICKLKPLSLPCILENCDSRSYAQKQWRVARQIVQKEWGHIPAGIAAFVTVSNFSRQILEPYLPKGAPIFQVDNPVTSSKTKPALIGSASPFLYVGRLSPEKGGPLLASAAAMLNCDVVFVGEGTSQSEIGKANPKAQLTGWLGKEEVLNWFSRARALVLPSLWYETQGLVVLEAAAAGIPAIVADTSAARDLVENGVTGLWFEGGNKDALCSAMGRLQETKVAQDMGRAAYERYWKNPPTLSKHVRELEECYLRVLAQA